MKVITLLNEKGGVGKTTLATHIAAGLAIKGYRVVLADADPQGQSAKLMSMEQEPGFYNLLVRDATFKEVLRFVPADVYSAVHVYGELYLLPGNAETRLVTTVNTDPFLIRNRFEDLDGWADVVIFDTAPTPSTLHTTIYMATDSVLLPTTPAFLGLDGIAHSIMHQKNAKNMRKEYDMSDMNQLGVIPTMFRSNTNAHDAALQQLVKAFRQNLWPAIPQRTVFEQAAMVGQLLYKYAPQDETTVEVLGALVDRVELGMGLKHEQFS